MEQTVNVGVNASKVVITKLKLEKKAKGRDVTEKDKGTKFTGLWRTSIRFRGFY